MSSSWKGVDGEDGEVISNVTVVDSAAIMSPEQFAKLTMACSIIAAILSLMGMLTNSINIRVFWAMGLNDSVTVSFFGLSVSDFLTSISNGLWSVSMVLLAVELKEGLKYPIDPYNFRMLMATIADAFYTVTILMSLFIAVTRCACVLRPLQFRHVFTAKRSVLVILFCNVVAAACFLPMLALMQFETVFNSVINSTRIITIFTQTWQLTFRYGYIISHTAVPVVTQVVLFGCVVAMSWSLKTAMEFRQRSTAGKEESGGGGGGKLSDKELQVVRQVVLLSVIFMICNMPQIVSKLVQAFVADFRIGYTLWPETIFPFNRIMLQVNSSVNILIYLKYNRKYFENCSRTILCRDTGKTAD